jgi:DNA repair exonuclease SbcCD ATPase subunit
MTLTDLVRSVRTQLEAASIIRQQTELINKATHIIVQQQEDIEELEAALEEFKDKEESINALKLEHLRQMEGMASAWLINLEDPDTEVRDQIAQLAQTLAEDIARIEEHVL